MTIEYEVTLNCNYKCGYCKNGRNAVLPKPIPESDDLDRIRQILSYNDDYYIYGGEPLLAKHIAFVVQQLKGKKYVVQTNFSLERKITELIKIDPNITFQVSIHKSQVKDLQDLIHRLNLHDANVSQIDLMFTNIPDLKLYRYLQTQLNKSKLRLIPVADFASSDNTYLKSLHVYNLLVKSGIKDVIFDDGIRSQVWEDQFNRKINIKGKLCICYDAYIQFDPALNKHHCPQRFDGKICPYRACFNLDRYNF